MSAGRLAASLLRLRDALAEVRLPLELPGSVAAAGEARGFVAQLDDYVLPRLDRLDAPLLAVIGGSTGAGKSTLVNSLLGRVVTEPGVIRPTTRSPVLVHHPEDAEWFASDQILPGLARGAGASRDARTLQVVPEASLPRGLALLDAPDVDSVVGENRALAAQLLAAADLWLFVTSAARYADAVPWEYLRSAAERNAVVAVVLDRVPPAAMGEVPVHLGQMMGQRGLGASPLFAVPETEVDEAGLLPPAAVAPIRDWLGEVAADALS
ncbi:MAG: GTPase, partial [Propionicimonas sp.]